MKLPRLASLIALLPFFAGCENEFTEFRVTNPRGELIAEWVARGYVYHNEVGYRITAVERMDAERFSKPARYPDGWRTTVVGPVIHHWRCAKPAWLEAEDRKWDK